MTGAPNALPAPPLYQAGHGSAASVALWHTAQINELLDVGAVGAWPGPSTPFPPSFGKQEKVLAHGPFQLLDFSAAGDGTYARDSNFFFATGRLGLALTAGHMVGQAIGNANRRRAARAAAVQQWREVDSGQLWVSTHAFYFLAATTAFYSWQFSSVKLGQLVGPGALFFSGESVNGPVSWVLRSDWAELVYCLWARAVHPTDPAYTQAQWLPDDWGQRVTAMRIPAPRALTMRSPIRGRLGVEGPEQ